MNTPTITMPKDQAREKLRLYRARIHKRADAEFEQIAKGYEALASGLPLIDMDSAIAAGGFFPTMAPKLAICRADRKVCRFFWRAREQRIDFRGGETSQAMKSPTLNLRANVGRLHEQVHRTPDGGSWGRDLTGYTMVPMVPADKMPATGQLSEYFILWEVEAWQERHPNRPPTDPYLLKHIGGSLYAVVAEWDLTELEKSVMKGRVQGQN